MPYASEKQRRFMYSQHPDIAAKFEKEGKNKIVGKKPSKRAQMEHKAKKGLKRAFPGG